MREFSLGPICPQDCELVVDSMIITTACFTQRNMGAVGVTLNQISDQEIGPEEHRVAGFRFEPLAVTILSSA